MIGKEGYGGLQSSVLGCTGSIGQNAIDVLEHMNIPVASLAACKNHAEMERLARRCRPRVAALFDEAAAKELRSALADTDIKVLGGEEGVLEAASVETDICVNAIVGIAGLKPTFAAIEHSRRIALANKETLVCAGKNVLNFAKRHGTEIIPVDSEHSAIFQALESSHRKQDLKRILLTASGGPFFGRTSDEIEKVTLADALKHPNWSMGAKITVDSATLMNKGLEYIEAMRLFDVEPEQIDIIIHRESIIHSMVEFVDGSVIAQLGVADMRIPIQYAVTYPYRESSLAESLDLFTIGTLSFYKPDLNTFKCLRLAMDAAKCGEGACVRLNAANEAAVGLFLGEKIAFSDIPRLVEYAASTIDVPSSPSIQEIFDIDAVVRQAVREKAESVAR